MRLLLLFEKCFIDNCPCRVEFFECLAKMRVRCAGIVISHTWLTTRAANCFCSVEIRSLKCEMIIFFEFQMCKCARKVMVREIRSFVHHRSLSVALFSLINLQRACYLSTVAFLSTAKWLPCVSSEMTVTFMLTCRAAGYLVWQVCNCLMGGEEEKAFVTTFCDNFIVCPICPFVFLAAFCWQNSSRLLRADCENILQAHSNRTNSFQQD